MSVIKLNTLPQYLDCNAVYGIEYTFRFVLCHKTTKTGRYYYIYDNESKNKILTLDFEFDITNEKNRCFSLDDEIIVFQKYSYKDNKYFNYIYDVLEEVYFQYEEECNNYDDDGNPVITINSFGIKWAVPPQTVNQL